MVTKNNFLVEFFREATGAGYADVDFCVDLMNRFHLNIEDIAWGDLLDLEELSLNDIIYEIFSVVIWNNNLDKMGYEIYTNSLDSHLIINGQEAKNQKDIEQFINQ